MEDVLSWHTSFKSIILCYTRFFEEQARLAVNRLEDVYTIWLQNLQFRTDFKSNPEKALKDANLVLTQ